MADFALPSWHLSLQQLRWLKEKEVPQTKEQFISIFPYWYIGASLKDLGKKWFAFSKMDIDALEMIKKSEKKK